MHYHLHGQAAPSFSSGESMNSSFSSDGSFLMTPPSSISRRHSSDSLNPPVKVEDGTYSTPSLYIQPSQQIFQDDHSMMGFFENSGYLGPVYMNQGMVIDSDQFHDSFSPISEVSPISEDFVNPTQTTLLESMEMSSPAPSRSFQLDLQYESEMSSYSSQLSTNASPTGSRVSNMKYQVDSMPSTPSRSSSFRQAILSPLESSPALQRAQSMRHRNEQAKTAADRHARKRIKRECVLPNNIRIEYQKQANFKCSKCDKRFERREHLKRHDKTHDPDEVKYPCQFCEKDFNRMDNLKAHIWIHADPNKQSKRTHHFGDMAMRVWLSMARKPRKSSRDQTEESEEQPTKSDTSRG